MRKIESQADQFGLPAATESDMSPASSSAQENAAFEVMAQVSQHAPMWSGPNDGSAAAYAG